MPEDDVLRERIVNKALKRIEYSAAARRVEPKFALNEMDKQQLIELAVNLGYDKREAPGRISAIFGSFSGLKGDRIDSIILPELSPGDMLTLADEYDASVTLLVVAPNVFMVVEDHGCVRAPGDFVSLLQYKLWVRGEALLSVRRDCRPFPAADQALRVGCITELRLSRNNEFLYRSYINSASVTAAPVTAYSQVYACCYDPHFNAFLEDALVPDSSGPLYEIDVVNMSYRLNLAFDIEGNAGNPDIFRELSLGFNISEDGDNLYLLQPVSDGRVEFCSIGRSKGLRIISKAIVTL